MKNMLVIASALFLIISIISGCCPGDRRTIPEEKYPIKFSSVDWKMNNNGTELGVEIDILSDFTSDACLILNVAKEMPSKIDEGFKDSLKIDGFYVRSYSIKDYDRVINGLGSSTDFPVYVKDVFIIEGKNHASFKIVFPETIASVAWNIYVDAGIFKFDDEIKSKFEHSINRNGIDYFKIFPDSSSTSYIFTEPSLIKSFAESSGYEYFNCNYSVFVTYYKPCNDNNE